MVISNKELRFPITHHFSIIYDLYLEGLESMTIFSMPGGTWGPVNLAEPVAESQDMEEGEGAISELIVSLRRLGVGE
mgnify:FL=1